MIEPIMSIVMVTPYIFNAKYSDYNCILYTRKIFNAKEKSTYLERNVLLKANLISDKEIKRFLDEVFLKEENDHFESEIEYKNFSTGIYHIIDKN